MRWLVIAVLASACATAPARKQHKAQPARSPQQQVQHLLEVAYAAVEAGDADRLKGVFTDDAFAFGFAPAELLTSREELLERLRQQLLPVGLRGDVVRVASTDVRAALAPGGDSAWLWDLPAVEHQRQGAPNVWLPRVTAHAVRVGGAWRIDALHLSLGVPDALVWAPDASRTLLAPAELQEDRGPGSDELLGLARRLTEDVAVKVERVTDAPEALLLGTDPGEIFIGGQHFKELVRPAIAQVKRSGFSTKVEGAMRARLAPDGQSGWVAAHVVLRKQSGKKVVTVTPFRALWVFVREGGQWNLASEHLSLALAEAQRQPATPEQHRALAAMLAASPGGKAAPSAGEGKDAPGRRPR